MSSQKFPIGMPKTSAMHAQLSMGQSIAYHASVFTRTCSLLGRVECQDFPYIHTVLLSVVTIEESATKIMHPSMNTDTQGGCSTWCAASSLHLLAYILQYIDIMLLNSQSERAMMHKMPYSIDPDDGVHCQTMRCLGSSGA